MTRELSIAAKPVLDVLEAEGFYDRARDLRLLVSTGAVNRVADMCHPKWLGDLYVKSVDVPVWWDMLETLKRRSLELARRGSPAPGSA